MELVKLEQIVQKYRKTSAAARKDKKYDKADECEDFANFVEDNLNVFEEEAYQTEKELWEDYESVNSGESVLGDPFADGDDD